MQKVMTAAQVLKHDEETDDSEKKWYQKVSWACVGFAVVLFILCAYSWFDVNTVSDEDTEEEKTFSEENGIYVNLVTGIILVFTQVRARARARDRVRNRVRASGEGAPPIPNEGGSCPCQPPSPSWPRPIRAARFYHSFGQHRREGRLHPVSSLRPG